LDFEVMVGLSGQYTFYAVYLEEGKNPFTDGDAVYSSNIAQVSTTLSDEPPLIPVVDCISVLPAPSHPVAQPDESAVVLSWGPVTGAASYVIYWRASDGSGTSLSVTATSYTHAGLINGVTYIYSVTALDTMGREGIKSVEVATIPKAKVTPPLAPTALSAEAGDAQVVFTWQGVTGATSYTVYWQSAGGAVESHAVSGTVFTHNGLVNGTSYTYWVKTVNATGQESRPSGSFTATPQSYRYTDNGNGTVTDNRSGLIWLKNANCFGGQNWKTAMQSAANLGNGQCGLSDGSTSGMWRLPTFDEWEAMVDTSYYPAISNAAGTGKWTEGDTFLGVQYTRKYDYYWSSTPYARSNGTWMVRFYDRDDRVAIGGDSITFYVWPVRGGQ